MAERIKYPIGIQSFSKLRTNGYLYVDKTAVIHRLASNSNTFFLSRPRRFGKSLLMSTLEAYFKGEKNLFKGLAIEDLEKEWECYPVFRFDLSGENFDHPDRLIWHIGGELDSIETRYSLSSRGSIANRFRSLIEQACNKAGKGVVVLIDEYDKPMLDCLNDEDTHERIKGELRGFYSVLKTVDECLRFAMLTGVTKFSHFSVFSGLNNLNDISLREDYNSICGITEEEMHRYFKDSVRDYSEKEGYSEEKVWQELKLWYDGYHFSRNAEDIYNPISVMKSFEEYEIRDYWFETGRPGFLFKLITSRCFEIDKFAGSRRSAGQLGDISPLDHDLVPLLYQSGYLTIKDYDKETREYILGFPNKEVSTSFWESLAKHFFPRQTENGRFSLREFTDDLEKGNVEGFLIRLQSLFAEAGSMSEPDKEVHFQNMVAIVVHMLGYTVALERQSSQGRCDLVIETSNFVYIFEFKVDSSPEKAFAQIIDKGYARPFKADRRIKILAGINFSTKTRTLDGWKIDKMKS